MNYKQSLKRPFSDWGKLGITSLLFIVPFLNLFTVFLAQGFFLECAKSAKKTDLPSYKNLKIMWLKGLVSALIMILYFIPALMLYYYFYSNVMSRAIIPQGLDYNLILFGLSLLMFLLASYMLPIALVRFAKKDSFWAAFKFKEIFKTVIKSNYLLTWITVNITAFFIYFIFNVMAVAVGSLVFFGITYVVATTIYGIFGMTMYGSIDI